MSRTRNRLPRQGEHERTFCQLENDGSWAEGTGPGRLVLTEAELRELESTSIVVRVWNRRSVQCGIRAAPVG